MEVFTDGTESTIVEINPNSLMSAFENAKKTNSRLRPKAKGWDEFIFIHKIDLFFIQNFIFIRKKIPKAKITIINKGLMMGFYIYSFVTKKAYYFFNNTNRVSIMPLKKYSLIDGTPEFDFVISYSNKDIGKARKLFSLFDKHFKVYFLDIEKVNEDPIWQIRYREAMYHSHYFIPFFTQNYLTTMGALSEFYECVHIKVDLYNLPFFNYFIPITLRKTILNDVKKLAFKDKESFNSNEIKKFYELLNDYNFSLKLDDFREGEILEFFESLLSNSQNNNKYLNKNNRNYAGNKLNDFKFLKLLLKVAEYYVISNAGLHLKIITLYLKRDERSHFIIDILSDGRSIDRQFTTEIQDNAIKISDISNPYKDLISFLQK